MKMPEYWKYTIYYLIILIIAIFFFPEALYSQSDKLEDFQIPPQVRMIRAYGSNDETKPPIIILHSQEAKYVPAFGEDYITIEFDVDAPVPPSLYAKFVHCAADWSETDNVFLNDIIYSRTSNITWYSAPVQSNYYRFRGVLKVPDYQVKFQYAGNWKMKLYELYKDEPPIAEARFFVVKPKADCNVNLYSAFYEPIYPVSPSAFDLECVVESRQEMYDNQLNTVVIYRNHRWFEPYYISQGRYSELNQKKYKYPMHTLVSGFASAGKWFRISGLPAENGYRILNLAELAMFPRSSAPVRLPMSDIRRQGTFFDLDDDGAMTTRFITDNIDEYINVEFVFDPEGWQSKEDVFISGSFNAWKPGADWQMYWDEKDRLYKLRHWVRRGKHNYLYGTGRYNIDLGMAENLSFDEYEGNTVTALHTYIAFVYYREFDYGGYDALIGIGASTIYGPIRK